MYYLNKSVIMNKVVIYAVLSVLLLMMSACGQKTRKQEPVYSKDDIVIEKSLPDTTTVPIQDEKNSVQEKRISTPMSSSSSYSKKAPKYDNMRGFDPASEDDMEDNGMSRYMENNDEEGWD